ncbi:MAG: homoserine kinase, partial [Actinomycetota bacterium]
NAAPAVFGGAHVIADGYRHRIGSSFPGHLLFWVPEVETLTDESRACLSPTVDRSEAIFNLGCIALLMAAVYEDRVDLLRQATQDRLHQPQRFASCELAAKAYTTALEAGAAAAWLSGSGPTVAVVVEADQIEPMTRVLSESGAVLALDVDEEGAVPVD